MAAKAFNENPRKSLPHLVGLGVIDDEAALFTASLQVEVHQTEGWVTVPLLPTTVGLERATLGGKDAPIFLQGGWYTLVTDRKGAFTVDLEFASMVHESNGSCAGRW